MNLKKIMSTFLTLAIVSTLAIGCKEDDSKKKKNLALGLAAYFLSQRAPGLYFSGQITDSNGSGIGNATVRIYGRNENSAIVLVPNGFSTATATSATTVSTTTVVYTSSASSNGSVVYSPGTYTTYVNSAATTAIPGGFLYNNSQGAGNTANDGSACTNSFSTSTLLNSATNCPATYIASFTEVQTGTSTGAAYVKSTCGQSVINSVASYSSSGKALSGITSNNVRVYCDVNTLPAAALSYGINTSVVASGTLVGTFTTDSKGNIASTLMSTKSLGNTFDVEVTTSAGVKLKRRRLKVGINGVPTLLQTVSESLSRAILEQSTGADLTTTESSYGNLYYSGSFYLSTPGSYDFQMAGISIEIYYPRNYLSISGTLSSNQTWDRTDVIYYLNGTVTVPSGITVTIKPGVTVYGSSAPGGALLVKPGGKLNAVGTAAQPILFTSEKSIGNRAPADWQGIILQGNGIQTYGGAGSVAIGEGDTGTFGGKDNSDSSGTMTYVVMQFAGAPFSPGNERNCLSLMGVGAGTKLSYLQCHRGFDDGFEMWGGAFQASYMVSTGNRDDMYDFADGFVGTFQFGVTQLYASAIPLNDDISRCIEGDGNSALSCSSSGRSSSLTTLSGDCAEPYFANITCVGAGGSSKVTNHGDAIFVRRAYGYSTTPTPYQEGDYANFLVDNYGNNKAAGCNTDSRPADARIYQIYQNNTTGTSDCKSGSATGSATAINSGVGVTTISETTPNFAPLSSNTTPISLSSLAGVGSFSATTSGTTNPFSGTNVNGYKWVDNSYYGAIQSGGTDWTSGWTSYPAN